MKIKRGDIVMVETDDIEHHDFGWRDDKVIRQSKPMRYLAIGWVIKATRRTLVLAPVTSPAESRSHCAYALPRGAIRKIKRWRP